MKIKNVQQAETLAIMQKVAIREAEKLERMNPFLIQALTNISPKDSNEKKVGKIANFLYRVAYFEADDKTQTIRGFETILKTRRANCVDYSVLGCALALYYGLPCEIGVFSEDAVNFLHVAPIIDGKLVDVVPVQNQKGKEAQTREDDFSYISQLKSGNFANFIKIPLHGFTSI